MGRTCREMQPLHLADDARASSLLRRVTGDLYIDGSSTGPAPVSRPTLWYRDAMWRDATFATVHDSTPRYTACDIRAPRVPHHGVTTTLRPRATPHRRKGMPRVQCRRSLLRLSAKGIVLGHSHTSHTLPFSQWSCLVSPSPPSLFLSLSLYLKNTSPIKSTPINRHNCEKSTALRNWLQYSINFIAMQYVASRWSIPWWTFVSLIYCYQ